MKSFRENRFLIIAVAASLLAHGALLAMHFVAPAPQSAVAADPGLEVILVNAKHAAKPLKADALAQANLDGGGQADKGRSKSPLPDMRKVEEGDSVQASARRIAELEQQQKELLTQANKSTFSAPPITEKDKLNPLASGSDLLESSKAIARMAAEISQTVEEQNKRPRKTFITPSTQEVGYAMYYKTLQKRIEDIGTLNFPQKNGRKMYGELVVYIPIFQDGTIYQKDGGARVERSSGNPALDAAALNIVRRAAPFGRFPPNMLSSDKDDLWVVITRFKFTREEKMEANLTGGNN
ncbi:MULTISPECIES: TonB family protein [unclassified Janthinobacterium]|uniref:energy transducer TonB family protein n=1 Tax=unclassified Janthinobacterium TaxID=2610881 RepID=UPI001794883E|nr:MULTISPECIES: TonB family protein [unclassified Janthinobacterium]MBB5367913.1 protein TonB [Janthinobacterium sp. K2C7]MBB5379609.1 protein TonB [Janthinobacterium sp. K2Li3]MBB5386295.1 protein TonB [Janthinobacterium sp. K2E3]